MEVMEEVCCPANRSAMSSPTIWSSVLTLPSLYFMSTKTCRQFGNQKKRQHTSTYQQKQAALDCPFNQKHAVFDNEFATQHTPPSPPHEAFATRGEAYVVRMSCVLCLVDLPAGGRSFPRWPCQTPAPLFCS